MKALAMSGSISIFKFFSTVSLEFLSLILSLTHIENCWPRMEYAMLTTNYFGSLFISFSIGRNLKISSKSAMNFKIDSISRPSYWGMYRCLRLLCFKTIIMYWEDKITYTFSFHWWGLWGNILWDADAQANMHQHQ